MNSVKMFSFGRFLLKVGVKSSSDQLTPNVHFRTLWVRTDRTTGLGHFIVHPSTGQDVDHIGFIFLPAWP